MNGDYGRFSVEHLMKFINQLDRDIEIRIKKHPAQSKEPAGVHITAT